MITELRETLSSLVSSPVKWQCPLDRYTSFSIGGPAEAIVRIERQSELQPLLIFLAKEKIPWRIIGRGTNLLVSDEGFPGVIVLLGSEFQTISREEADETGSVLVRVGGGYSLGKLCHTCLDWGLTGVEFGCGIPGTIGGAIIMNAGAWGKDMSAVTRSISLVTDKGTENLSENELTFSYRCWQGFEAYKGRAVVTEVELTLRKGDSKIIKKVCHDLQNKRKATQPSNYANGGSFFKNPTGDSAGRLIDASGLKGAKIGGAMVSDLHANFIVNTGNATAGDVLTLMKKIQEKVKKDSGIHLEPELHFI